MAHKEFNAEISKLLNLVINSLYTDKNVFIRELISNASDACNKRRYLAIENQNLVPSDGSFKISISINPEKKTITFEDNGIGMNEIEMEQNIGTIASSGTQKFLQNLQQGQDCNNLIGQFGVGFYSSFMVADKVEVISKKAGEGKTYHWISDGSNGYTIEEIGDIGVDGTRIICHLKEDCVEKFTDKYNIENAIKTNSNYIETPIYLALNDEKSDKQINSKKAIWNKAKSEISTEEYKEFYNQISHLPGDQFMTCHYKLEGDINFNALLFIPGMKPFDLFHPDMMTRIQLYTKSVRIGSSDENSSLNLVPRYLRFLRGVVDCNDIPLNVSRETLQDSSIIAKIKNLIIKKIINELTNKKENELEEYKKFWNNFGAVLLEGLCEYSPDRDSILKLCLFESYKSSGNLLSIDNYIQSMPEGQDKIYYLIGEDINDMVNSPQLEGFKKKNIDVLLLNKPVDRFWVTAYNNYGGKNFQSITNSEINLDKINNNDDKKEVDSIENQEICTAFKKVFDGLVKDVKVSKRLLDSPMCLSVEEGSIDIQMEKFLKEQGQLRESQSSAMIVEINTDHIIIKNIYNQLKENSENANAKNKAKILLELSYLSQGILPKHPNEFTKSIISLIG